MEAAEKQFGNPVDFGNYSFYSLNGNLNFTVLGKKQLGRVQNIASTFADCVYLNIKCCIDSHRSNHNIQ